MAKDNRTDIQKKFDKRIKNTNENFDKLNDKLSRKVYGVGNDVRRLIDMEEDISPEILNDIGYVGSQISRKHLMNIVGKDSETNLSIDEVIEQSLSNLGKHMKSNPTYQERIMLEHEYNYLCAQMPQLLKSIQGKINNIISPDGFNKTFLHHTIVGGEDEGSITESDVKEICDSKELENLVKDTYTKTHISGTKYIYVVPYQNIAERIYNNYIKKDKNGLIKQTPENISFDMSLYKESIEEIIYDTDTENNIEYIKESIDILDDKDKEDFLFTENAIIDEAKDSIAYELINSKDIKENEKLYSEARKPFRNITGCYIDVLENENVIPVIINRKIIGIYYIEDNNYMRHESEYHISNVTGSQYISDVSDRENYERSMGKKIMIEKISDIIKRNLDKKMIKKNKNILSTIEAILDKRDIGNTKIRYIPRKYFVPFTVNKDNMGLGRSQLHKARIIAHIWILLNYSNAMNKLFHEKDKIVIDASMSVSKDISSIAKRALRAVKEIYPLPSQLLDISKTYGRMADVGRLINPVSKNGKKAMTFDRLEGQRPEENYEYKKELEQIATVLVGIPFSLTDVNANTDFATNLISQDAHEVSDSINYQINLEKELSELTSKIISYEKGIDIAIKTSLPIPKSLTEGLQTDALDRVTQKINTTLDHYISEEDSDKREFFRKELYKKETASNIDWNYLERLDKQYEAQKKTTDEEEEESGSRW